MECYEFPGMQLFDKPYPGGTKTVLEEAAENARGTFSPEAFKYSRLGEEYLYSNLFRLKFADPMDLHLRECWEDFGMEKSALSLPSGAVGYLYRPKELTAPKALVVQTAQDVCAATGNGLCMEAARRGVVYLAVPTQCESDLDAAIGQAYSRLSSKPEQLLLAGFFEAGAVVQRYAATHAGVTGIALSTLDLQPASVPVIVLLGEEDAALPGKDKWEMVLNRWAQQSGCEPNGTETRAMGTLQLDIQRFRGMKDGHPLWAVSMPQIPHLIFGKMGELIFDFWRIPDQRQ